MRYASSLARPSGGIADATALILTVGSLKVFAAGGVLPHPEGGFYMHRTWNKCLLTGCGLITGEHDVRRDSPLK